MQSYLRWKEDQELTSGEQKKEAPQEPDSVIEELNVKEPYKYKK